ncbi:flagellar filament capping protein FliD [Thiospirillum jenense]|uniref:Flagellar hook-associated protein 2 n=1 Tax=Thiospirillum jenense TaxID=1653858 RepID=A0A839HIV2_9GAMM|nr:flagellar filament capping protein FliD [Thiospirillum jenense]MBB1126599.1 flagellar filament capping protein FliD [Thiospirillum jenense]
MAGIQATGLGSGLDISGIVSGLVSAERSTKDNILNRKEATLQSKISAYGALKGALSGLESPLTALKNYTPSQQITVGKSSALSATSDNTAAVGNYSIKINKLAQSQSLATTAFTSSTDLVGAGTLTLQVGTGAQKAITIEADDKLTDVRDMINESGAGISAAIVNDASGARLVLSSSETGAANTITATVDGTLDTKLASVNMTETRAALDAEAEINGLIVTSDSNVLDDAVEGLTLTLKETTTEAFTVGVSKNTTTLKSLLEGFVASYNSFIEQSNSLTKYDTTNKQAATLTGDSLARSVRSSLSNGLVYRSRMEDGTQLALANLGVISGRDGTLSLDAGKYNTAMDAYGSEDIATALKDIADNMSARVTSFTNSTTGRIKFSTDGLQTSLEMIEQQRTRLDARMEAYEARLSKQFNTMDTRVASLNSLSSYLSTQLASMANISTSNK